MKANTIIRTVGLVNLGRSDRYSYTRYVEINTQEKSKLQTRILTLGLHLKISTKYVLSAQHKLELLGGGFTEIELFLLVKSSQPESGRGHKTILILLERNGNLTTGGQYHLQKYPIPAELAKIYLAPHLTLAESELSFKIAMCRARWHDN